MCGDRGLFFFVSKYTHGICMEWSVTFAVSGCATLMHGPCSSDCIACLPSLYVRGKTPRREKARVSPFERLAPDVGDSAFLFISVVVLL